jgi:hypothetical protein
MKPPTPLRLFVEVLTCNPKSFANLIFGSPIRLTPDNEVIELLKSGISFVRWGDGETAIARNKSIYYQQAHPELRYKLIELSKNPPKNVIIGLPWVTYASMLDSRWNTRIFGIMFSTRVFWAKRVRSSFLQFRFSRTEFWWDHAINIPSILKDVKKKGRHLVLVGPSKFLKVCPPGTSLIEIPQKDAFAKYMELTNAILKFHRRHGSRLTIVMAAGPTSKALAQDFSDKIQVIDIGHGFDFSYHQSRTWSWSKEATNSSS